MNQDLMNVANKAFKIGQINGKAFVTGGYLKQALNILDFAEVGNDAVDYIKDALKEVREIEKLTKQI